MSVRPPNLQKANAPLETGASILDGEIMAEMAASLSQTGRALEAALSRLEISNDHQTLPDHRETLLRDAAEKAWALIIQYELCGLSNQKNLVQRYRIPPEVMARVGMARVKD